VDLFGKTLFIIFLHFQSGLEISASKGRIVPPDAPFWMATIEILEQACWHRPCKYFLGKTPCKKSAELHPSQGNLLQRNIFSMVYKTPLHLKK
jgi:hypothetical protein